MFNKNLFDVKKLKLLEDLKKITKMKKLTFVVFFVNDLFNFDYFFFEILN